MIGSWAGAMGHTQWMPEVWLNVGVDYDKDGRITPFGKPDDAFAGTARYLVERGQISARRKLGLRGQAARAASKLTSARRRAPMRNGSDRAWCAPTARPFARPERSRAAARAGRRRSGISDRAEFLGGDELQPGVQLRARGRAISPTASVATGRSSSRFPGGERTPTIAEVQEIQRRLTALGFDTDGTDGRVGRDTMKAVRAFQRKSRHDTRRTAIPAWRCSPGCAKARDRLGSAPLSHVQECRNNMTPSHA